jgi:phosphohistidine phosphatase
MSAMPRLIVLRHAKSSWKDESLDDFDRPLSGRGVRDGKRFGAQLGERLPAPDRVLCSTARRTRDTLAFLVPGLVDPRRVSFEDELYLAPAETLLERVQRRTGDGDPVETLLLIGHNPGLTELVNLLVDRETDRLENLPTFGVVVLEAPEGLAALGPGKARRALLRTPKADAPRDGPVD